MRADGVFSKYDCGHCRPESGRRNLPLIVRTDRELGLPGVDAALRAAGHELVLLPDGVGEDELIRAAAEAALILMCYTPIGARAIASAPRLKGIVKYGVGIDAIDIAAARARGIPVVNVPEYAEETVAEGAMALLLALAKRLQPIGRAMAEQGWIWPEARWLGGDLAGKTLGLIGLGRIGRSMARMAGAGFRMRVLAYDPHAEAERFAAAGVERRGDLLAMLAECDAVSVHCVLNQESRGLIGARAFAAMKPSALFVNVSRGAIVDEAALLAALAERRIAGAALDVYASEPLRRHGHPLSALYAMDNVILFPHLTFFTQEACQRLEADTLARCFEILEGRPVLVKSRDPRLRAQGPGVRFVEE
ncbi:MAG: C-terminal binding protein [Alphaproteobacteria bacterium]|nr:C-terminal binding protein [Alphaproteobacteria bacterium]